MSSTIQVRVDDNLKVKSDELFRALGTDTTSAIRMFLTQAVIHEGFPFEIKASKEKSNPFSPMGEEEMLEQLSIARNSESVDANKAISEMRAKYGF